MKDNNSKIKHSKVRNFPSKYSSYIAAERWFKGGGNGRPRLLVPHSVTRGRWGRPSPGIRHMILTVRGATSTRISTVGAVAGSVRSKWCPRVESFFWAMITKLEFVFRTAPLSCLQVSWGSFSSCFLVTHSDSAAASVRGTKLNWFLALRSLEEKLGRRWIE